MTAKPKVLLEVHLKALRLPTFLREYDKVARQCAAEGLDCPRYLLRLSELELLDREQRATERRIKAAKFPVLKSLETFEFRSIPSLNKSLVLELARSEYLDRRENVLALGNSGTGKTHLALALGLAACQKGYRVRFTTAAALVHELLEARDDKRLLRLQKQLAKQDLLIVDELGYVPLSKTGSELLFEIFSQRYERASTLVTSNLLHETMRPDPARRIEVLTELRPREDAAVKADQGDPFRFLARPAVQFQLAISSPQVRDHLLISVPRTVQKKRWLFSSKPGRRGRTGSQCVTVGVVTNLTHSSTRCWRSGWSRCGRSTESWLTRR